MQEVQDLRDNKQIPGARQLHEYANLYFDAHNPMLSRRREQNAEICVLRVASVVLDVPGAIVTDRNAASKWVRFYPSPDGLRYLDGRSIYAQYWTHTDQFQEWEHKSIKCAEVLVPDEVPPHLIVGAYVANQAARGAFAALNAGLAVSINGAMFF
jgi:hypothetical protein